MKIASYRKHFTLLRFVVFTFCFLIFGGLFFHSDTDAALSRTDDQPVDDAHVDAKVARIGLVDHGVSFRRGDDDQWLDAGVNTPLQSGDQLFSADDSHAEVQLDGNMLRLNSGTHVDISDLSPEKSQFSLYSGTMTVNVRYPPKAPIEVDSPHAAITITEPGEYRIDAHDNGAVEVIAKRGHADVYDGNNSTQISEGHGLSLNDGSSSNIKKLPARDDWDGWNQQRDHELEQEVASRGQIDGSSDIAGVEDLDNSGEWSDIPEYGRAWSPSNVGDDWAPYGLGRWMWRDPFGWSWVSTERWGWAPYHYGRWTYVSNRWYWVPGARREYSPALVGFMTYKNGAVGWVPLSPRDRFDPWWGPSGRRMSTSGVFLNQRYRNAITATSREGLISGRIERDRRMSLQGGHPISRLDVVPTRESLAPRFTGNGVQTVKRPAFEYSSRSLVVKRNQFPVVRPFSEKEAEIKKSGGSPVSEYKRSATGVRVTEARSKTTGNSGFTNYGSGDKGKGKSTTGNTLNPNPPSRRTDRGASGTNDTSKTSNANNSKSTGGKTFGGGNSGVSNTGSGNSSRNVNSATSTTNGNGKGASSNNSIRNVNATGNINRAVITNTGNVNSGPKEKKGPPGSVGGNNGTSGNAAGGSNSRGNGSSGSSNTNTKKRGIFPILTGNNKNNNTSNGANNTSNGRGATNTGAGKNPSGRGGSTTGGNNNGAGRGTSSTGNTRRTSTTNSGTNNKSNNSSNNNSNTKKKP